MRGSSAGWRSTAATSHTEDIVWLPDGAMFHASGWPGMDPWELAGDPHAVAAALGITDQMLEDIDVDLDAEPEEVEWADCRVPGPWGGRPVVLAPARGERVPGPAYRDLHPAAWRGLFIPGD